MNQFFNPENQTHDWSKGIPRNCLKKEWDDIIRVIQHCITCEGWYTLTNLYHMIFLVHIVGIKKSNVPYFMIKSLTKMSTIFGKNLDYPAHYVFHRGLINISFSYHIYNLNWSWENFLFWGGFQLESKRLEIERNETLKIRKDTLAKRTKSKRKTIDSSRSTTAKGTSLKGEPSSSTIETRSIKETKCCCSR